MFEHISTNLSTPPHEKFSKIHYFYVKIKQNPKFNPKFKQIKKMCLRAPQIIVNFNQQKNS